MKQAAIVVAEDGYVVGGIILDNGDAILCDEGKYVKAEDIQTEPVNGCESKAQKPYVIEEVFEDWTDLTQPMIGY